MTKNNRPLENEAGQHTVYDSPGGICFKNSFWKSLLIGMIPPIMMDRMLGRFVKEGKVPTE